MKDQLPFLADFIARKDLLDSEKLLWLFLLDLNTASRNAGGEEFIAINVTHVASILGRSRQNVSKGLSKLIRLELIMRHDQRDGSLAGYSIHPKYAMDSPAPAPREMIRGGLRVIEGGAA